MTISKECTDFLRDHHMTSYGQKLKATHAREIVAAFFGYKSHAAQLAETQFPLSEIEVANILAPDVPRIEWRIARLNGLPSNLPEAYELARVLGEFLVRQDMFQGRVWLYDSLGSYVVEELLQENHSFIEDEMSGEMASTNAIFDEYPEYEPPAVTHNGDNVQVIAQGTMYGSQDLDRPYSGHEVGINVIVTLHRVAGHVCFMEPEIDVGGALEDGFYAEA